MTKKSIFLGLLLSLLAVIITFLPLLSFGRQSTFFSLDPDAMYVGNIISFFRNQKIYYIDHPGTPSIIILAAGLLPLKGYVQFIVHEPFYNWIINHPNDLYFYLRIFQGLISFGALFLYLAIVYLATKSLVSQIFAWIALFSFSFFPYIFLVISAEATNFMIISIWLVFLLKLIKTNQSKYAIILSFISGLALANRLTNLFVVFASLSVITIIPKKNIKEKTKTFFYCLTTIVASFLVGTWAVKNRYVDLFSWVSRLATTSEIHGEGNTAIFDPNYYLQSTTSIFHQETTPILIIGLLILLILHRTVIAKHHIPLLVPFVSIVLLLGSIIFAKYPLTHYQLGHYYVFIFLISLVLAKYYRHLIIPISLFLLFTTLPKNIGSFYKEVISLMSESSILEKFVIHHPPQRGTVWEWGLTGDFAILWGRDWSGDSYDQELRQIKPNLFSLQKDYKQISISRYKNQELFETCWDQLYIQKESLNNLLKTYPDKLFSIYSVPNTKHALVTSSHCLDTLR